MIALARTIALVTGGLWWGLVLAVLAGFAAFRVKAYVEQRLAIRRALRWVNANRRPDLRIDGDPSAKYEPTAPDFPRPMSVRLTEASQQANYHAAKKQWKQNQGLNAYRYTELDDLLREAGLTSEVEGE